MGQLKDFVKNQKKALIPFAILISLLLVAGDYFSTKRTTDIKEPVQKIEEKVIEQENANEENKPLVEKKNDVITNETKDEEMKDNKQTSTNRSNVEIGNNVNNISSNSTNKNSGNNTLSHTHSWKNHTASKQVWVENWGTIPDYETQTIYGGQLYTQHSDGQWYSDGTIYWFYTDTDKQEFKKLIKNMIKNEGYIGNYVNRTKTKKVQVGSHQEDQGQYEIQTYVDYQYCTCA